MNDGLDKNRLMLIAAMCALAAHDIEHADKLPCQHLNSALTLLSGPRWNDTSIKRAAQAYERWTAQ